MPIQYIPAITKRYENLGYQPYRWFRADTAPAWQPLQRPLAQSRLGLLSSAGIYTLGQIAFHFKEDTSIRKIPMSVAHEQLRFCHTASTYLSNAYEDSNCVLPRQPLKSLVDAGILGAIADEAVTCMGAVYSARRAREELAPRVLDAFQKQQVDVALLIAM